MKCPKHYCAATSVGTLHVISRQPLADCGNYLFRCVKDGKLFCPACGIVNEPRRISEGVLI